MIRIFRVASATVLLLMLGGCGGGGGSTDSGAGQPAANPPPASSDTSVPRVSILAPSATGSYTAPGATVALTGTASDNVGVARVSWRNAATGASGNASGTGNWSIASVALATGTNTITVSAHDAAANTASATLAVLYDPSGQTSISGRVDSALINRAGVNAVYVYSGNVVPNDLGGNGAQPVATAPVTQDNGVCTFSYRVSGLPAGTYTIAFTSDAANDNPAADDAVSFRGTTTVTVAAGGGATRNFQPNRILQVGPTRALTRPSAAAATAQDGDVIEIDAAAYLDDVVVWRRNNLTLRGVGGGRAHMRATRTIPFDGTDTGNGKGIWVQAGRNLTVENIEFSGAKVPDENGAGIRADSSDLTVCNGYFHDNENGILGGGGIVTIEYSEFNHNGLGEFGRTHNMYISEDTTRFTLRYSYSHHAHIGHNVKSRAQENHILYNRIMDEASGDSSYAIDLPDTGLSFIIGNLIQQGPLTDNSIIVAYGAESGLNGRQELYVVNNTLVNDRGSGTFLDVRAGTTARVVNNIFSGGGTVLSGPGTLTTNLVSSSAGLADVTNYDYRLTASSPARNAGSDPGSGAGVSLTPTSQYVHPHNRQDRPATGAIDIGAYEFMP